MKIVVVGTGYVGLVAGACLAECGHEVVCVENNADKLKQLIQGKVYFFEPGLEALVEKNYNQRLFFTGSLMEALTDAQVVFIAVGTPAGESGEADLRHVYRVAKEIGSLVEHSIVVVNKSTVPVGTNLVMTGIIRQELKDRNKAIQVEVVSNPEFLRQGSAVGDFMKPDRVVLGAQTKTAFETMINIYLEIISRDRILCMDPVSAEMTKYAANAFLATKISFANEIGNICHRVGANIELVSNAIGMDHRICPFFLNAGIGYGGSCFPKDVKALIHKAITTGYEPKILKSVEEVNHQQKVFLVEKLTDILTEYGLDPRGMQIAVWGVSFKPDTDDMREAPSQIVVKALLRMGCEVVIYDPVALKNARSIFRDAVSYAYTAREALIGSHALFLLTEWPEFGSISVEEIRKYLELPLVLDGRNFFSYQEMLRAGLYYVSIGRSTVFPVGGLNVSNMVLNTELAR